MLYQYFETMSSRAKHSVTCAAKRLPALAALGLILAMLGCTQADFNNPLDPENPVGLLLGIDTVVKVPLVLRNTPNLMTQGQSVQLGIRLSQEVESERTLLIQSSNASITLNGQPSVSLTFQPENSTVEQQVTLRATFDAGSGGSNAEGVITALGTGLVGNSFAVQVQPFTQYVASALVINVPNTTSHMAVADFDQDGRPDIAVVTKLQNFLNIHRNTSTAPGSLSFAAAQQYTTRPSPISIAIANFDGNESDGTLDVGLWYDSPDDRLSTFLNTGSSGTVSMAAKTDFVAVGAVEVALLAADLNLDGKPEVITLDSSFLRLFRNNSSLGLISFASQVTAASGWNLIPRAAAAGDLDGDGKPDIVVLDRNAAEVFRNTSSGPTLSLATRQTFTVGTALVSAMGVDIADVDGDGKNDLIVSSGGTSSQDRVHIFRNTSSAGTIAFAQAVQVVVPDPGALVVSDLDGNGTPDLAVLEVFFGSLRIALNTSVPGLISFGTLRSFSTEPLPFAQPAQVLAADVDGDGRRDILVRGTNTIAVHRNTLP